jgi:proline iminopeptidase
MTARWTFTLAMLGLASCAREERAAAVDSVAPVVALPPGEHYLAVEGGRIWYKVSGSGAGTPVVLLHGGPGVASYYLKPLEALGDDRPVVRYDQLGTGKADLVTDTTLFTVARYVQELEALRAALGYDRMHVVGHSWGTMLAMDYYAAYPGRVASLTLASPALNAQAWAKHARALLKTLPDSMQRAVASADSMGVYDGPAYQAANAEFMARFVVRRPRQADSDSTMARYGAAVYSHMWGPSEFTVLGTLKGYNAEGRLKDIRVPTLFTVGEFDEADPALVRRQAARVAGAKFEMIKDAAHLTTWDNEVETLRAIRAFLREADARPRAQAARGQPGVNASSTTAGQ